MRTLRSPEGCPWDREQTLESLTPFVLEEAHEVIDAIERGDMAALKEEIGDHIFEGVFLAQVAADSRAVHGRGLAARGRGKARPAPSACLSGGWPRPRCRIERARADRGRSAGAVELAQGTGARRSRTASLDARQRAERRCRHCCARTRSENASRLSASTGTTMRT